MRFYQKGLWQNRPFLQLWSAQTVSLVGSAVSLSGIALNGRSRPRRHTDTNGTAHGDWLTAHADLGLVCRSGGGSAAETAVDDCG